MAVLLYTHGRTCGLVRCLDGRAGDVELRAVGAARQFLDGAAIKIARREVHVAKRAAGGERVVHQAYALEQLGPISVGNHAQAGDDVAHRDDPGPLPLVFVVHDHVCRRSLRGEVLVEPCQRGGDPGILIAQPVYELDGEGVGQVRAVAMCEHNRCRFGGVSARTKQAVGETVRLLSRVAAADDQLGHTPEVFDQHDPERNGNCPELADGQRLHLLVGVHEAAQHVGVEMAVGVCNESPGHTEHPRVSCEWTSEQLRQLPVVAGWQCGADFSNFPLDEVVVID